jgi:DNA polymerase I-like protein with 3'-5' exonuclease and polymerase domains
MYGVPYNDSKAITFRQLYGGVQEEYLHIPLFSKVSHKIDKMWMEFNRRGYVETPLGRKLSKSNLRDMNANKLFNYMLQATETELNMKILSKVMEYLKEKQSKMVLYTYDSYLLDVHPSENELLKNLKILIEGNGFPTKIEIGDRYSEMKSIDLEITEQI